jgi:hypothetical protein
MPRIVKPGLKGTFMQRRAFFLPTISALLPLSPAWAISLSETDAASGVRAALERGALAAVSGLGRDGGFLNHPTLKIELPGQLKSAAKLLKATGQGKKVDALVLAMNRAAEQAGEVDSGNRNDRR